MGEMMSAVRNRVPGTLFLGVCSVSASSVGLPEALRLDLGEGAAGGEYGSKRLSPRESHSRGCSSPIREEIPSSLQVEARSPSEGRVLLGAGMDRSFPVGGGELDTERRLDCSKWGGRGELALTTGDGCEEGEVAGLSGSGMLQALWLGEGVSDSGVSCGWSGMVLAAVWTVFVCHQRWNLRSDACLACLSSIRWNLRSDA